MILRVARHTDKLEKAISFYVDIIGLEILGDFKNHDGYDGVFIGNPFWDWHFEFTLSQENPNHILTKMTLWCFILRHKWNLIRLLIKFTKIILK